MVSVPARRQQVAYGRERGLSARRACTLFSVARHSINPIKVDPSRTLACPVPPGADIDRESGPLGSRARDADVFHVRPARSIFSKVLNFCRSAIAALVRSP
jgi:hypothetical protein